RGYRLVLEHPWSLRAMLVPPTDLNVGECYVTGVFDVEGTMIPALRDVASLMDDVTLKTQLRSALDVLRLPAPPGRRRGRVAELVGRQHSLERDAQAIQHHYDVGNDFYRLFLDQRLVYSCAYFAPGDDDLDRAQERKLDLVCRKLRLTAGERFLDIGCGWGALVIHAAKHYGVRALGVTLSEAQHELARKRIADEGLEELVEVRLQDYREIAGQFDAVASVGMVEHVGADHLEGYFSRCYDLTAPGGRFLNHGITTGQRDEVRDFTKDTDSFVGRYVFPDGALVPAYTSVRQLEQAGFELVDVQQLRRHYARTLTHWVRRLESNADRAREVAGEGSYRTWRAYMSGSVVGFESGDLGVVQILGSKDADLPLGRDWMQPHVI
ncbi:MAG: cyclopropane-fatty-acyl-phospholipid synthase family protein, partial [Nitriliruptorales bacterium]|nr:cyclopropane-fatty-acyl-phospholipid synthase family protein [Nitriliruptorales bacterium]